MDLYVRLYQYSASYLQNINAFVNIDPLALCLLDIICNEYYSPSSGDLFIHRCKACYKIHNIDSEQIQAANNS